MPDAPAPTASQDATDLPDPAEQTSPEPVEPEWDTASEALAELPELDNGVLRLRYRPDHGGEILSLSRVSDDLELLWRTPWLQWDPGPRAPATAHASAAEQWSGGWRSLFPNSGRELTSYGVDWGFDGEACLASYRARPLDVPEGVGVELSTRLVRTPFRFVKRITLQGSRLRVTESAHNTSRQGVEIMAAQQLCFAPPLIGADAVIESGATVVRPEPDTTSGVSYDDLMPWPRTQTRDGMTNLRRLPAEGTDVTRQAYLTDFTDPHLRITNPAADVAVQLRWDGERLPHLWYELESGGRANFPHYSGSYYLSLSPSTSWPRQGINDARLHSSSSRWIFPGDTLTSWVELEVSDAAG